jgi:hypothetical protein
MNFKRCFAVFAGMMLTLSFVVVGVHSAPRTTQPVSTLSLHSSLPKIVDLMEDVEPPASISASLTDGQCAEDGADISWSNGSADSGVSGYKLTGTASGDVFLTGTSYHDGSITGGQSYTYSVYTLSNADNLSSSAAQTQLNVPLCILGSKVTQQETDLHSSQTQSTRNAMRSANPISNWQPMEAMKVAKPAASLTR